MRRAGITLLLLVVSCTRSAANHEELGDRAYAAGAYVDALAEYDLARKANASSASVLAKVGAAAMHAEDYELAADAYRTLAKRDRSRADEAADGLDRVARAALTANDRTALASALTGLR
jgi:tetratricopeptide (TPR) repeat protein